MFVYRWLVGRQPTIASSSLTARGWRLRLSSRLTLVPCHPAVTIERSFPSSLGHKTRRYRNITDTLQSPSFPVSIIDVLFVRAMKMASGIKARRDLQSRIHMTNYYIILNNRVSWSLGIYIMKSVHSQANAIMISDHAYDQRWLYTCFVWMDFPGFFVLHYVRLSRSSNRGAAVPSLPPGSDVTGFRNHGFTSTAPGR